MRVNEVEKLTGLPSKTIKYYEQQKLIIPGRNSVNQYREYTDEDIKILNQIKLLRKLGFSIENIRRMRQQPNQLKEIFTNHINKIDSELNSLQKAKEICKNIISDNNHAEGVDFADYLEKVSNMEVEGYQFMDENMKEKRFKKDARRTIIYLVTFLCLVFILLFSIKEGWNAAIVIATIVGGLVLLVIRHARTTGYICTACDKRFNINPFIDFISPHSIRGKYLRCPHCRKRTWAKESYRV